MLATLAITMVAMLDSVRFIGSLVVCQFKIRAALQLEDVALRQQRVVVSRSEPKRLRLTRLERLVLGSLHHLWPEIAGSILVVRPNTVVRWHAQGFHLFRR